MDFDLLNRIRNGTTTDKDRILVIILILLSLSSGFVIGFLFKTLNLN